VIGWRPYLFTALALILLALMVLDVTAASRAKSDSQQCAVVTALAKAGFRREASRQYETLLEAHPGLQCAQDGQIDPTVTTP
jgi:outer membrane cobalamin receptor